MLNKHSGKIRKTTIVIDHDGYTTLTNGGRKVFKEDRNNRLMFNLAEGLRRTKSPSPFYRKKSPNKEEVTINCAIIYNDSLVLEGTNTGFLLYNTIQDKYIPVESIFPPLENIRRAVTYLVLDEKGTIWFADAFQAGILYRLDNSLVLSEVKTKISPRYLLDFCVDKTGNIWILSWDELRKIRGSDFTDIKTYSKNTVSILKLGQCHCQ